MAPFTVSLGTGWQRVVNYTHQLLESWKEPLCPLGEPQSWCGCFGEGKKLLLLLNQTSDCPAHSVVTMPTTLSGSS
jgi:hypothetical protein